MVFGEVGSLEEKDIFLILVKTHKDRVILRLGT